VRRHGERGLAGGGRGGGERGYGAGYPGVVCGGWCEARDEGGVPAVEAGRQLYLLGAREERIPLRLWRKAFIGYRIKRVRGSCALMSELLV
jgi:hypothetical protein